MSQPHSHPWILFADPDGWRAAALSGKPAEILRLDVAPDAAPADLAQALHDAAHPASLILALGSPWCLCAKLDRQRPSRHWRDAMAYQLERQLPMTAEQLVADYAPAGAQMLAVAADLRRLTPPVEALRAQSIALAGIYPTVFLAVQHMQTAGQLDGADTLLLAEADQVSLVQWPDASHGPTEWHWLPADARTIAERLAALESPPRRVLTCGLPPALHAALSHETPNEWRTADNACDDLRALAAAGAWNVHAGRARPAVNLARGPLAPTAAASARRHSANFVMVAALLLAVALNAALLVRSYRYDRLIAQQQTSQRRLFSQVLPGTPPVALISRRMESEYRALAGSPAEASASTSRLSMLHMMWDVFNHLSPDPEVTLEEVTLGDGAVTITGAAPDTAAIHRLTQQLSHDSPVQYNPPQSRPSKDIRPAFSLTGRWTMHTSAGGAEKSP